MSEQPHASGATRAVDLDRSQASLAYSIISALLEHTRVVSDLVALMAQVLDEETTKALTNTPQWQAYLDSRRAMERTRAEVEQFTEVMTKLAEDKTP
jgi:hypothetical protein